ncbi:toluene hydroxylase [Gordonia sp. OPL2]|uniref:toluene hydroxylase n=1 Tax=Gordonia sp. OPL2 TaxID=2486274 RepID=UPI0016562653|nr:toluene hydroxylase [Gordonia sp. OPL2]ROZ88016.1 toluene hydroxylase [Gordonia sp. OPL2]
MSEKVAKKARKRGLKTWSAFGNLGRRPTEYEILTHNMNHTTGEIPLEMGPDVHGNAWLREHRDSMPLREIAWDDFRDPDTLTYGSYVASQDDQETYIEYLLEQFDSEGYDEKLNDEQIALLRNAITPTRYVGHAQQMLSAYLQQLAVSSYVANCAAFQTADQLRRVQTIAYRTTQLKLAHPEKGFATGEKSDWTDKPLWQPIREAFEWALVEFDWDRAFVVTNLVVKPIADRLFLSEAGLQLARIGARLDSLIAENLYNDSERSRRWSAELVTFVTKADQAHLATLQSYLDDWVERGEAMIEAGAALLASPSGRDADTIAADVRKDWHGSLVAVGLSATR